MCCNMSQYLILSYLDAVHIVDKPKSHVRISLLWATLFFGDESRRFAFAVSIIAINRSNVARIPLTAAKNDQRPKEQAQWLH